jgi:hypothetical protein
MKLHSCPVAFLVLAKHCNDEGCAMLWNIIKGIAARNMGTVGLYTCSQLSL